MRVIYRYQVEPNSIRDSHTAIEIRVPLHSTPLCVQKQGDNVCIWAEVDKPTGIGAAEWEIIRFASVGTGHGAVPPNGTYFGTVMDGPFVWHFYRLS